VSEPAIPRRRALAGLAALAALAAAPGRALALGRTPVGGRLALHVPWPTAALDPHELRDPAAALFGHAVFDSVYALGADGAPYPTLAAALPAREAGGAVVRLREGLRTARGVALDARDLVFSVERARARGAAAWLADLPRPVAIQPDAAAVLFRGADPAHVARALASPLVALVPRRFDPSAPDGTGAFRADASPARLTLSRNLAAARGPAFLDAIDVAHADDLKTSLREFEAQADDVGWLGMGLHDARRGAQRFDLGAVAWIVLATGADAGGFGLPGVAQRLADALPPERLAHLGLGALPRATGDAGWGGPPAELTVDESSPHLVDVAQAVAPILSRPGHEVTAAPVPRAELARRRARNAATLAIDLVRPLGPTALHALVALATADDAARARDLVRHPPRVGAGTPVRALTSTLRLGVVGEVRVAGGAVADAVLARAATGDGWDLGASYRRARR
jgi:peptide/nickel transport system substrate-binding protein